MPDGVAAPRSRRIRLRAADMPRKRGAAAPYRVRGVDSTEVGHGTAHASLQTSGMREKSGAGLTVPTPTSTLRNIV